MIKEKFSKCETMKYSFRGEQMNHYLFINKFWVKQTKGSQNFIKFVFALIK